MKKLENICYTDSKLPQQTLDVYLPDCDVFPVFVYFHGGGMESGDKADAVFYDHLCKKGVAAVTGFIPLNRCVSVKTMILTLQPVFPVK